uniref:Integrase, catalytic region, zinc finger, CCHC-type, peptidase aspartic, catalytic n=1 Tax=Tanacetum cinerariifolium TaxID=118510 RepID=A0A6L2N396_TANCI|nr:hypothetical protein [Tanacetum cinerariifolium]
MLMKGTGLSYQERECRLYNLFDKFAHVLGEKLYEYYWRFSQLINKMHTIRMTMQQVQVHTKFLNALPSEWSKFVSDVKLAKSLYTTNYDRLYAYFSQHKRHANEVRISHERYPDSYAFIANSPTLYNLSQSPQHSTYLINPQQQQVFPSPFISPSMTPQPQAEFPQLDFGHVVPMFQQEEDLIECINKAMVFLSAVASSQGGLKYADVSLVGDDVVLIMGEVAFFDDVALWDDYWHYDVAYIFLYIIQGGLKYADVALAGRVVTWIKIHQSGLKYTDVALAGDDVVLIVGEVAFYDNVALWDD